jgi:hypothetical protein
VLESLLEKSLLCKKPALRLLQKSLLCDCCKKSLLRDCFNMWVLYRGAKQTSLRVLQSEIITAEKDAAPL